MNVAVDKKFDLDQFPEISRVVAEAESRLGGTGRVLLRPSGTEPVIRVMVEGKNYDQVRPLAEQTAKAVENILRGTV